LFHPTPIYVIPLGGIAVLSILPAFPTQGASRKPDRLDIPDTRPVEAPPDDGETNVSPSKPLPEPDWPAGSGRADLLLRECLRSRDPNSPFALEARRHLRELGEEGRAGLEAALASKHPAVVAVAADVLAETGSKSSLPKLRAALAGKAPREALEALSKAVATLDPEGAPVTFLELLAHGSGAVRARAAAAIGDRVRTVDLPVLLRVFRAAPPDGRERAARLLSGFEGPDVHAALLEGLSDPAPRVARACADTLALSTSPEILPRLNRIVRDGLFTREWAYACLALAMRDEESAESAFEPGTDSVCLEALGRADPFVSGAAAVALASIGYRSANLPATSYLDGPVPDALVRALAGQQFYPDFTSLLDLAERRLVLLTGESAPRGGPGWAAWWLDHRGGFRANRATFLLPEDVVRGLVLVVHRERVGPDEAPLRVAFRAEGAQLPAAVGRVEEIVLDAKEVEDLARRLRESEILLRPTSARVPGVGAAGSRALRLLVGGREKTIEASSADADPAYEAVEAYLLELRRALRWQRYHDPERWRSREEFLAEEREFLAGNPSAAERARHDKERILRVFPRLPDAPAREALADLEGIADLHRAWEAADDERLLARLSAGLPPKDLDRAIVVLLLRARGAGALAGVSRKLEESFGEWGREVLASALVQGSGEARREALRDAAPFARGAAARAASRMRDAGCEKDLLPLLADPEGSVRTSAIEALGRIGSVAAVDRIAILAREGDVDVRKAALLALGRLPGDVPLEALTIHLGDPRPEVRQAAIEGLAERGDARSAGALVAVFVSESRSSPTESMARRGLLRIGEGAWEALRPHILDSDPAVARSVRILLAELGDGTVVPALLEDRTRAPGDPLVKDALSRVTLRDFSDESDPGEAWRAWWEENREKHPRQWFLDALSREGIEFPGGPEALARDAPPAVLEALARAVENASWPVAARAAAWAGVVAGEDFGGVARRTTPTERSRLASRIRDARP
jgi:HEAT repeat protein